MRPLKLASISVVAFEVLVAIAVVLFLCGTAGARPHHKAKPEVAPHLVNQVQRGGARYLYVHNTLDKPIWAWFECTTVLTIAPIGILPGRMSEVVFHDIPTSDECVLNHWAIQQEGRSPPEWRP